MTEDNVERQVRKIAEKMNGDKKTLDDLWKLIMATDADANTNAEILAEKVEKTHDALAKKVEETHRETLAWHDTVLTRLNNHCEEADLRDERIAKLEAYREDQQRTCAGKVKSLIDEEHSKRHEDYVASISSDGKTLSVLNRKVWVMWAVGIFIAVEVGQVIIGYGLDKLLRP